jgi:hypothetical protein
MRLMILLCCVGLGCGEDPPFPEDYQTSWQEVVPCSEGSVHDGDSIRIFVNATAQPTWSDWKQRVDDAGNGILPPGEMIQFQPGAVLLKAQYGNSNCSSFKSWTMMTRLEVGGDTAQGNWRWETILPDEDQQPQQPTAGGASCFECHQNYRRTDYAGNSQVVP